VVLPLGKEVSMALYSMDLRTRVLRGYDGGLSSKDAAEKYHVSRAWVDLLKQRRRESRIGRLEPTAFVIQPE
jgi:transposase